MDGQVKDLWPDIVPETVTTPFGILQEQATNLERRTKGILSGSVERQRYESEFYLSFNIVAPSLDRYEYELLRISHGVEVYPVTVVSSPLPPANNLIERLGDEKEFVEWLGRALACEKTKRIIGSLLAQSGVRAAS